MKMELFTSTKAQAWYIDFILALTIFGVAFAMYLNTTSDILDRDKNDFKAVQNDAERISSILLTQGYPGDWDNSSVQIIGIALRNRINESKLLRAANVSYDISRTLFSTKYDYLVFFKDKDGNIQNIGGVCGIGKNMGSAVISGKLCSNFSINADKIVQIQRTVIYKSEVVRMVTFVWD